MGQLVGLSGVKGALPCQHVATIDQAIRRIEKRRAVTTAGSCGAINVWRDDQRRLRSEFMRYRRTLNSAEHTDAASLRAWLERWWPELERVGTEGPTTASAATP